MLKDDNLLISEPGSNDLVLLSTKFEEIKRLKGIPGDTLDMEGIRSSSTSNDGEHVLWFQGGNRVSLVNTSNLDITNIIAGPGMYPFIVEYLLPISATANTLLNKCLILSLDKTQSPCFQFWQSATPVTSWKAEEIRQNGKLHAPMCLEVSLNDQVVFIGGSDNVDTTKGRAVLSAHSFDRSLFRNAQIVLSDTSMRSIFKLRRLKEQQDNILLASGFNSISIIYYNCQMDVFQELKSISNIHDGTQT